MNLANDSTAWILSTATIDSAQQFIAVCPFDYSDEMIGPSLVEQESELSDFGFKVYPNPTMNYLNIESEILEIHYVLYELNGAVIHNGSVNSTAKESIDLSKHPPGVYLLQLNSEHGTYSYKILKY
jgi:hypothetical protein